MPISTVFTVDEPRPHGFTRPIPLGRSITLRTKAEPAMLTATNDTIQALPVVDQPGSTASFKVVDRGQGRAAFQTAAGSCVSVSEAGVSLRSGPPGDAETFQWIELDGGDLCLLSLASHRYLAAKPKAAELATALADPNGLRPPACTVASAQLESLWECLRQRLKDPRDPGPRRSRASHPVERDV